MSSKDFLSKEVPVLLQKLSENTPAVWGKMNSQQMVEHLCLTFAISNGKIVLPSIATTPEKSARAKQAFFEENRGLPKNLRTAVTPEEPNPPYYDSLERAKEQFFKEMTRFNAYYTEQPAATFLHPIFGALDQNEWLRFHEAHIRHHFEQFSLINPSV